MEINRDINSSNKPNPNVKPLMAPHMYRLAVNSPYGFMWRKMTAQTDTT